MKRSMIPYVLVRCLLVALFISTAQDIVSEEIRSSPLPGGAPWYVDVDSQGRLLRIDYAEQRARVLGRFEIEPSKPPLVVQGWVLGDNLSALLLLDSVVDAGWHGRIHLHSRSSSQLRPTSLRLDLTSGDFAFLSLSEELAFVEYRDTHNGSMTRLVFRPSRNQVSGSFDFSLAHDSLYWRSYDGDALYLAHPLESKIRKISLPSYRQDYVRDAAELVGVKRSSSVFVNALGQGYALVSSKHAGTDSVVLYLLDLKSMEIVARSERLPFFAGRFEMEQSGDGTLEISCLVQHVIRARYKPTGVVQRFVLHEKQLRILREFRFDPESQIGLRSSGRFQAFPRYSFDYVSLLSVKKAVLSELPSAYSPEIFPLVASTFKEVVGRLNSTVDEETFLVQRSLLIE